MNVSELARQLRIHPKEMLEVLPKYGFDIGARAVKVDDKVAERIIREWRNIKRHLEERKRKELEEQKLKERELRKQSGQTVMLPAIITVRSFAERLHLSVTQIITELMKNGILANQNQNLDFDTASIIAQELGFAVEQEKAGGVDQTKEAERSSALEAALTSGENKAARAPVVVVMGHVDHGKTTLLDVIREANIVAGESGGITQHIGAYQTIWKDPKTKAERAMTFIDTPGHEAFTVMRSRGAKVADMAILVVAADDGVKPQTKEVIQIIKAAKLPFVVAMNKIDKEGADPQRVKTELATYDIIPEDWGGNVPVVEISAKKKLNIDKLLDVILLLADINGDKIQADPSVPAVGTIIESHVDKHSGPIATVLVQSGTLRKNDPLVINNEIYGKVRAMRNYLGKDITEAGPSVPVQIIGLKVAAEVGDVLDIRNADTAEPIDVKQKKNRQVGAEQQMAAPKVSQQDEEDGKGKKMLNLLVKADVLGSLEAIIGSLEKIKHDEVGVQVIGKGLGNINEDDVNKAETAKGTVIAFHVNATPVAQDNMREKGVPFIRYEIIYDLLNWVKGELEKMLDQEKIVTEVGTFKILAIFRTDKGAMTIGGRVEQGKLKKDTLVRVKRGGEIIGNGKITTVQSGKTEVKEVPSGSECGARFEGKVKIEVDDVFEVYTEESKARKIIFQ